MVRVTDYDSRRKEVLRAVIELYLQTARPVSSESLLEQRKFNLSSATIRNVFKDLENKGFLTHPHTSAGRVPTDLGYRFYINDLMERVELSNDEKKIIEQFFRYNLARGNDAFENASRILSNFTHYAGIASHKDKNSVYYCGLGYLLEQPEFHNLDEIRSIFRVLEEDRLLDLMRRQMEKEIEVVIGCECNFTEMSNCSLIVCECEDSNGELAKVALLGPKRMAYKRVIPMMDYIANLISEDI